MLLEQLKIRRSIRKFQDKQVEKDKIDLLLKSALLAPSSRSIRPWQFIAVDDANLLAKLSLCKKHGATFLANAPHAIVVIADSSLSDVWIEDSAIASTLIQLTAHDLGLGSCWIQIRERDYSENQKSEDYIKKLLSIPESFQVESIIAIGYPDEEKKAHQEDALLYDKIHYNKY